LNEELRVKIGLSSETELGKAEDLINNFFISRNDNFKESRILEKRYLPLDFTYQNYIQTYFNSGEIYSIQRFKKRKIFIQGKITDVFISTDFIVDKNLKNHSVSSSIEAIRLSNNTLADKYEGIILGDARKALGAYLEKFDYFTIGNYFLVTIENLPIEQTTPKGISIKSSSLIDFYEILGDLKSNAEMSQFLRFQRQRESWEYISKNPFINKNLNLYTFWDEKKLLAYIILNIDNEIVEYGEVMDIDSKITYSIKNLLVQKKISKIRLDPMNAFYKHISRLDLNINLRILRGKGQVARTGTHFYSKLGNLEKSTNIEQPHMNISGTNLIKNRISSQNILLSSTMISELDWF
jgi:hypothetical protein